MYSKSRKSEKYSRGFFKRFFCHSFLHLQVKGEVRVIFLQVKEDLKHLQGFLSAFEEEFAEGSQAHHQARRRMSQSARATTKGQRKGINPPSRASPPLPPPSISSSTPASAPTASSGDHG